MMLLLISILLNTSIIIIFRVFSQFQINNFPAIVVNYWVCVLTGCLITQVSGRPIQIEEIGQQIWLPFAILLGATFVTGFYVMAEATQKSGVTLTTIASKTSMIVPTIMAFFIYKDAISSFKIIGIILAVLAVFLTAYKSEKEEQGTFLQYAILPFLVFAIGGFIEVVLNYVQAFYIGEGEQAFFLICLFGLAASIGTLLLLIKRERLLKKDVIAGVVLGIPNYLAVYFFLLTLDQSGLESSVIFPVHNVGIVLVATLIAFTVFKEKISKVNWLGISLSVGAILLICK